MNPRVLYRAATYATDARAAADSVISALTPAAWYRNATGVTESGGFASQWDDYSGNGRHLIQLTGTNQPAYSEGVFTFDGLDNFLQTGAISIAPPFTFVGVFKQVSWTASDALSDGGAVNQAALSQTSASPTLALWGSGSGADNTNLAIGSEGIVAYGHKVAGTTMFIQVNATAETTRAGDIWGLSLTRISLGNSFNTRYANMSCREFILFNSVLSSGDRTALITALNNAMTVF